MWTVWFVVECAVGVVAAILVWLLIVAVVVTHLEQRHSVNAGRHHRHRPLHHGPGR
jgi:hypothetical protein